MAANPNMPQQMGLPMQQQGNNNGGVPNYLTHMVYQQLVANTPVVNGWQTGVQISERLGKAFNL